MALLPPFYLDAVVALGIGDDPNERQWIGTGFIVGKLVSIDNQKQLKNYKLWLVTNKHVLSGLKSIYIKLNSAQDPKSKDYKINLVARNGKTRWIGHTDAEVDVAVIFLNAGILDKEQRHYKFVQSDAHMMNRAKLKSIGVSEGERVFVLGFPMGLVDQERQYVICRGGYMARVRDFMDGRSSHFLIDAPVFPGNSGGPVIICPSATSTQGTQPIQNSELVGMVKAYVPYQDMAISAQTRRPRITFEENSGLALVESVDSILETVALAEKRLAGRAAQAKARLKKRVQTP